MSYSDTCEEILIFFILSKISCGKNFFIPEALYNDFDHWGEGGGPPLSTTMTVKMVVKFKILYIYSDAAFEEDESVRRIVAFIGGLDITDGRYDTPEYHLFKTINTTHQGDFYQNCVIGATKETGPREPWHDIHAKVEGSIALDIKKNFEERW